MDWTVLVVDDEPEILRTLRNFLTLADYTVVTASGGEEALKLLRGGKIHIVLCDIRMPEMDGLTLLEKIRTVDFSIQVIMMTGYSTFDSTLEALEKGATDYVLKPFENLDDVLHLVQLATEKLTRWKKVLAGSSKAMGGRRRAEGNDRP